MVDIDGDGFWMLFQSAGLITRYLLYEKTEPLSATTCAVYQSRATDPNSAGNSNAYRYP